MVVAAEIQKLEEQLSTLKAEQMILSSRLYKKIEKVEGLEAQLAKNNIALDEPRRIFTIMETYHSRIAALAKDVNL